MLTRRGVLTGTAAASIAAIASAHGVAAAPPDAQAGLGPGFGNLADGAAAAFHKHRTGFALFLKWSTTGAEVFYKETPLGAVDVFFKFFHKGWSPVTRQPLTAGSLEGADAFLKIVTSDNAEFFIKLPGSTILTSVDQKGVRVVELDGDSTDIG